MNEYLNFFYQRLIELTLHCDAATEGCVSNDLFRHSLDDSLASYLTQLPSPSLNTVELIVIHNRSCEYSSKLQLSIRFTPSRCLDVRQDWYPMAMYYPKGMKARVSPVQSIEPHRILAPTRDSNQEPPDPQSRVITTILLHTNEFNQCSSDILYSLILHSGLWLNTFLWDRAWNICTVHWSLIMVI